MSTVQQSAKNGSGIQCSDEVWTLRAKRAIAEAKATEADGAASEVQALVSKLDKILGPAKSLMLELVELVAKLEHYKAEVTAVAETRETHSRLASGGVGKADEALAKLGWPTLSDGHEDPLAAHEYPSEYEDIMQRNLELAKRVLDLEAKAERKAVREVRS